MRNMTARSEAKAKGEKTYETGQPCKQGHLSPRATRTGTCVECTRLAAKAWLAQRPGKMSEYVAAYRERNKTIVLEKDRLAQAARRASNPEGYRETRSKSYRKKVMAEGREVRPLNKLPVADLVMRMQQVWGEQLQYVSGYVNMNAKAVFLCTEHEKETEAHPNNVLKGANPCPKCNHMASKGEASLFAFLSNLAPAESRNRSLLKPKELDIYLPDHKLAIEYCGEYHHSSGDRESERAMRRKHIEKYKACAKHGIRLITLWEAEWKDRNYAVRRLLRNAVGKSKGKLMARKCELRKATHDEAKAFYDRYHPQGGSGHGEHYALFWNGKMVACMRFVLGANDRGAGAVNRVWTLGRYATRITVAGAASRLFKAFLSEVNPTEVKSFSDNRMFSGGMYEQLGFELEEEVSEDYVVWSPYIGTRPKSHYQRRQIPARLKDHGIDIVFDPEKDPRNEAEMTYLMGARRLYDCGKKRWVWTRPN